MAKYIDKDMVMLAFENAEEDVKEHYNSFNYIDGSKVGFSHEKIEELLNSIPTADVAPVIHGKWNLVRRMGDGAIMKCSICGREYNFNSFFRIEDCPYCHCGAKMNIED